MQRRSFGTLAPGKTRPDWDHVLCTTWREKILCNEVLFSMLR